MELLYCREFVTLADTGNYLQTAELLYMAQSTLSRHIQHIERQIGTPLFLRSTRKVELTEAGKIYYRYAKQAITLEDEFSEAMQKELNSGEADIICGMIPLAAKYGFRAITALHVNYPGYHVKTVLNDSNTLKKMLRDGSCDFCLVREFPETASDDYGRVPLYKDRLQLVVSSTHPLAAAESVSLTNLKEETFLLPPAWTENHIDCVSACQTAGFTPALADTIAHPESLLDMVELGMGITILPSVRAKAITRENIAVVNIIPQVVMSINILYHKSRMLSESDRIFLKQFTDLADSE